MSTAEILQFPSEGGGQERRVADLDDGYIRLATMILEELAGADLTKRQFKVILAVIRLTYGWNKARDRIANSQLSEIAKLPVKRVSETRVQLIKMNILHAAGQQIGINKNVSEWDIPQNEGESLKLGDKESLKLGYRHPSKQGDTIDIITKDKTDINKSPISPLKPKAKSFDPLSIPIPEWLNADAWRDWVSNRAETKKSIKTERAVSMAFKLLKECLDEGHNPTDVINASIANGWQGLFKPKFPARKNATVTQVNNPMNHIPEGFTG